MNSNQEHYLHYCKNALELGRLQPVEYSKKAGAFWTIPTEIFKSGVLPSELTNELFEKYYAKHSTSEKRKKEICSINLIVSPQAIKNEKRVFGALNIACSLSKETGKLTADLANGGVWIPKERLTTLHTEPMDIMVGSLEDFRKFIHEHEEELESKSEVWSGYLAYADSLFEYVKKSSHNPTEGSVEEYTANEVYLTIGQGSPTNASVVALYDSLLSKKEMPRILETMLNPTNINEREPTDFSSQNEQMINSMITFCGNMGNEHPLADSQRNAVYAYIKSKENEIIAVSGPPGTGKTTMLQAMAANLITVHALEQKKAPIIIGTSATNQAVTNIIDSFSGVVPEKHSPLDFRWLIKSNKDNAKNESSDVKQTLPGIAAYCPSFNRLNDARKEGYLIEQTDKSGVYSEYSSEDYQKEAEEELLKFGNVLLEGQFSNLKELQTYLRAQLVSLDRARKELIKSAAAIVSQNATLPSGMEYEAERLKNLSAQGQLVYWMTIEKTRPMKRFLFWRWPTSNEEDLIYANKREGDSFPNTITTLEGVKNFYKQEMDYHEKEAERIRQVRAEYTRNKQSYNNLRKIIESIVSTLTHDETIFEKVDKIDICNENTLLNLDKALDTSVRYVEFWLSIHYYECQWLIDCSSQKNLIPTTDRRKNTKARQGKYWNQIPSLTPCMVMTEFQLPKYFTLYDVKEHSRNHDFGRIDLLIVDEAGQVDTPLAFASFALAKRAVVVGDTHQLSPIWSFTSESDREVALDKDVHIDDWNQYTAHGLTASEPSNLMRAAENACCWRLFLEEHYRCVPEIINLCNSLIYDNRLIPSRPSNSKLSGFIEHPFMYHKVPNSKDMVSGSSRKNQAEADSIIEWIRVNSAILLDVYGLPLEEIIGIVTPFSAQANLIRSTLQRHDEGLAKSLKIGTAHSLQGAERPVILFSVVYGNETGRASFMEKTPELTNVAVSRAKDLFIAFGSEKRLKDSGDVLRAIQEAAVVGDGNLTTPLDGCPKH